MGEKNKLNPFLFDWKYNWCTCWTKCNCSCFFCELTDCYYTGCRINKIYKKLKNLDKTVDICQTIIYYIVVNKIYKEDKLNIQYKKGVLELCILSALSKRDMYGYELSEYISEKIDIADGTVYPILRKLKADGLLKTYLSEDSGGPPRKYYSLTETGSDQFKRDANEWLDFAECVKKIIKGEEDQ